MSIGGLNFNLSDGYGMLDLTSTLAYASNGIKSRVSEIFDKFREKWTIVSKSATSMRLSLKSVRNYKPKLESKLKLPIFNLGVLSGVNVMIYPVLIYRECQAFPEVVKMGDSEGAALAGLGISAMAGDALDSLITLTSSLSQLGHEMSVPEWFSYVGLPLNAFLATTGLITRYVNVKHTKEFLKDYNSTEFMTKYTGVSTEEEDKIITESWNKVNKGYESFYEYLSVKLKGRKIGVIGDDFDAIKSEKTSLLLKKKERKLARATSFKVAKRLGEIAKGELENAESVRKDAKTLAERKVKLGYFAMSNSMLTLASLAMLFFSVGVPFAGVVILALTAFVRLGAHLYEAYYIDRDLTSLKPKTTIQVELETLPLQESTPSRDPYFDGETVQNA